METPTVQRRRLGLALKRAREEAGITQSSAGEAIDAAANKISRIESGQSGLRQVDLDALIKLYGIALDEASTLKELARAGRQRGRWSGHRNAIPTWFRQYVDLEADASEIRWYQCEVIPGILQTEGYMQAMNATHSARTSEEDEERQAQVRVRLERQRVLDTADVGFILSESAVRRMIGSAVTMSDQLQHLTEVSRRPNVELQVLPFEAETYATSSFGFISLRFGHDVGSDVIYVEGYTSADYLDHPEEVRAYTRLWNRLQAAALGPVESGRMIETQAEQLNPAGRKGK